MKYSEKFTMINYEIILKYHDCDCRHPNAPWEPCCGCGLPDCPSQNMELPQCM